ncbi:hypothetical protein CRYUN_Cryun06bG0017800 [Craigia yunnanensis]
MAPTAAMLILSHQGKPTSPALPPPLSPPLEVKVSSLKWVALGSLLIQGRSGSKSKEPKMEVDRSFSADSAWEKWFQESLELSWW